MHDLPFLIVHGPLFWKLTLVGLVVCVLGAVWIVRRAFAIAATRTLARRVERGDGVVVGVLRGGSVKTLGVARKDPLTFDPSTCAATWQAPDLWLETTTHGRVALAGSMCVVAGTRAAFRRGRLPDLSEDDRVQVRLQIPAGPVTAATLRTLETGDAVVARGRLVASAPRAESDYRSAETAWTLHGGDTPIELAARTPRAPRVPLALSSLVAIALGTAAIGWFIQNALGQDWVSACRQAQEEGEWNGTKPWEISSTHSCVLASSMASSREHGLSSFYALLERHPYRDEATVQRLDAISRLGQPCNERIRRMMRELRYEVALDEARACFHRRGEHDALVALGRYDEAVHVVVEAGAGLPALPTVSTLIAAGRWLQAAEQVEPLTVGNPPDGHENLRLQCFSQLLRHHGGKADAVTALKALADHKRGDLCLPMLAAVSDRTKRMEVLQTIETRTTLTDQLLYADGIGKVFDGPERVLARPESTTNASLLWLVAATQIDHPYADRLRWIAASQVVDGDHEAAKGTASRVVSLVEPDRDLELRDVAYLPPLVALYSPSIAPLPANVTVPEPDVFQFWRLQLRAGVLSHGQELGPYRDRALPAFLAAQKGDGLPLATYLASNRDSWWTDGDLIAVLPRVTQHRAELVQQLRWRSPDANGGSLDPPPVDQALRAFLRRSLFEAAGLTSDAAGWAAIYQRIDRVLGDRDRLVAMMVWSSFSEATR